MSVQLIRISNVTISVPNLYKAALDERNVRVLVYVKDREDPFQFHEQTKEKATALYVDLCRLIQTTQHITPFLFFANVAVRLELLTSIHTEASNIYLSASGHPPEVFSFSSVVEAQQTFDDLMHSLGIGKLEEPEKVTAEVSPEKNKSKIKQKKTPRQKSSQKPPGKVPRKRGRSVEVTKH